MHATPDTVLSLVRNAFRIAWNNKQNTSDNGKSSSYFVSEVSNQFQSKFGGDCFVQKTDIDGKKTSGEWLLDIAIVTTKIVGTSYKNREAIIADKILWAIESEFSTNIKEFCKDFSKLLHIKADAYLYIAGLNQITKKSRTAYIQSQIELAKSLVTSHRITSPFYIVFIPTPGKSGKHDSVWDMREFSELESWIQIEQLSSNS